MATYNFLDKTGLSQVWGKIKNYINNNFLSKTNTTAYTPTTDYHPATKKYVDDSIDASSISPDWNENDTTSANFIANRTHWVEEGQSTQIINETITFEDSRRGYGNEDSKYYESVYNQLENAGVEECVVVFDGQTYNVSIIHDDSGYDFGNLSMRSSRLEDTGEPFYAYLGFNYFEMWEKSAYTGTHNIDIYISPKIYHKLDNKYLNGTLIQSGTGEDSEIFNGVNEYKMASGDYSHVEGYADSSSRYVQINLTGDAGATEYSCMIYGYRNEYESIIENGLYSLADSNYSTINQKISSINISSSSGDPIEATIYFNETLSQDTALSNQSFYLFLPQTIASNVGSHAEGSNTMAMGSASHSEGSNTIASGNHSHAEGGNTTASGGDSHAEGLDTNASGDYSHAEGQNTTASGDYSHAEGLYTTAQRCSQHVFGQFNVLDTGGSSTSSKGTYIEIVGKGTSNTARSNARTLDWNGNEVLAGKLTVGAAPTNNMDVATKQYVDNVVGNIESLLTSI